MKYIFSSHASDLEYIEYFLRNLLKHKHITKALLVGVNFLWSLMWFYCLEYATPNEDKRYDQRVQIWWRTEEYISFSKYDMKMWRNFESNGQERELTRN